MSRPAAFFVPGGQPAAAEANAAVPLAAAGGVVLVSGLSRQPSAALAPSGPPSRRSSQVGGGGGNSAVWSSAASSFQQASAPASRADSGSLAALGFGAGAAGAGALASRRESGASYRGAGDADGVPGTAEPPLPFQPQALQQRPAREAVLQQQRPPPPLPMPQQQAWAGGPPPPPGWDSADTFGAGAGGMYSNSDSGSGHAALGHQQCQAPALPTPPTPPLAWGGPSSGGATGFGYQGSGQGAHGAAYDDAPAGQAAAVEEEMTEVAL